MKPDWIHACTLAAAAVAIVPAHAGAPLVAPAFTYQGELRQGGAPVTGTADFQFRFFGLLAGGVAVSGTQQINNVALTGGRFTVGLGPGSEVFNGSERYLEIAVRAPAGGGAFTTLSPRQRVAPTPYAIHTRGIYVTDDGDVGIGTLEPQTRLHLEGGTDTAPASGGYLVLGDTAGLNVSLDNNEIMARNNGAVATLSLNAAGGNVGIGTVAPAEKLHVVGGSDTTQAGGGYIVLGSTSAANISIDNNEIMARNNGVASVLSFNAAGGDVNILPNGGGSVGVGTNAADARLHVVGGTDVSPGSGGQFVIGGTAGLNIAMDNNEIMARNDGGASTLFLNAEGGTVAVGDSAFVDLDVTGNITAGAGIVGEFLGAINTNSHPALFGRNGTDGVLVQFFKDAAFVGSIAVFGGVVSYNAFTGSHHAWIDAAASSIERGTLVTMTGRNRRLSLDPEAEVIYGIAPSSAANDPRCMGAYLGVHELARAGSDPAHLVMAVGNGEMWVTQSEGAAGAIEPGDYLIASDIPGCAMKDDPIRFPIGHIVARAAEGVDWSGVKAGAAGVKRAKISVFFENFARDSDSAALTRVVQEQQLRIAALEAQLASLDELAARLARLEGDQRRAAAIASVAAKEE